MRQNEMSQAQQKNEKFRNQIRSRIKNDYMRKIRSQLLRAQLTEAYNENKQFFTLANLEYFANQPASVANLAMMNRILLDRRYQINQQLFRKLFYFIQTNFLNQSLVSLSKKYQLNDFIALFSNLIACEKFVQLVLAEIKFAELVDNLVFLIENTEKQTGSLILWLLFQILPYCDQNTLVKIANYQLIFKEKVGFADIHLSYLLCCISQGNQNLIKPQIIEGYANLYITFDIQTPFCFNIITIFDRFLQFNKQQMFTELVLDWITIQLLSQQFPPLAKKSLFQLLFNLINGNFELTTTINFISHGVTVVELVQRILFDSGFENKKICISCLISLIKKCPKLQLEMLILSYPSVIQAIVSSFSLNSMQITLECLKALTLIVVICHENKEVKLILLNEGAKQEIELLTGFKNEKIAQIAYGILEYLEN